MNSTLFFKKLFPFIVFFGLPLANFYHETTQSIFLNAEIEGACGLEKLANQILAPTHYFFAGRKISICEGGYVIEQKYQYDKHFAICTATSILTLPISAAAGGILKTIAMMDPVVKERHQRVYEWMQSTPIRSNLAYYENIGIDTRSYTQGEVAECLHYQRRRSDLDYMKTEQEALREIAAIFTKHNILFWIDCGSCLGAYRYGGGIPWDCDCDLAILQPDFSNALYALKNELNPDLYIVQDWSGRDFPHSYLKVYVKKTRALIDIYHFRIDEQTKTISSIESNEKSIFMPKWWKEWEARYTVPTPLEQVFPLKQALFDGIVVPVPNKTKEYLQARYGEDLSPVKIYNEETQTYEKDLNHPYWKLENAY